MALAEVVNDLRLLQDNPDGQVHEMDTPVVGVRPSILLFFHVNPNPSWYVSIVRAEVRVSYFLTITLAHTYRSSELMLGLAIS